jgi:hypothetical protein
MKAQDILTETFTTKEEYLTWRTEWRKQYAEISEDIRRVRQVNVDASRNPATGYDHKTSTWTRSRAWTADELKRQKDVQPVYERSRAAYKDGHKSLSALAHALMDRRKWSKEEAQRQYLAAHAQKAAA